MRNICILITILLVAACTKEAEDESYISLSGPDGKETRFIADTVNAKYCRVYRHSVSDHPKFFYVTEGWLIPDDKKIWIGVSTDSLAPGHYSSATWINKMIISLQIGSKFYHSLPGAQPFVLTVSNHANGTLTGTFKGRLYTYVGSINPTDSIDITGKISKVGVHYK